MPLSTLSSCKSPAFLSAPRWLAALCLLSLAACGAGDSAEVPGQLSVYTSDATGFDTHSYYYDTGSEVVVFDAQFTPVLAQQLIAAIHSKTTSPIRYVVITHPNPDKFNGAPAFRALGAQVIASAATAAALPEVHAYKKNYFINVAKTFTEATYPPLATVDQTFSGRYELPLVGGARVVLYELAHAGVSTTQTVAHIPAIGSLIVGDLVHVRAHAWLEGGIRDGRPQPDLASWQLALAELAPLPGVASDATVYGGRGDSAPLGAAVATETSYLGAMQDLATRYVTSLGARRSELFDPNLAPTHYKNVRAQAEAAYPEYALGYLIEYGVYGLLDAIAAQ